MRARLSRCAVVISMRHAGTGIDAMVMRVHQCSRGCARVLHLLRRLLHVAANASAQAGEALQWHRSDKKRDEQLAKRPYRHGTGL